MKDEQMSKETRITRFCESSESAMTRRSFLRSVGMIGAGVALSPVIISALAGCESEKPSKPSNDIKMGIGLGNQTLWRYTAQKNDELLKPKGYNVTFINYLDGDQLAKDFISGKIDVCAAILNTLPALSEGSDAQAFLPIAWMKWGFPIVVSSSSGLNSVADLQKKKLATFGSSHPSTIYWQAFAKENYGLDLKEKVEILEYAKLDPQNPAELLSTNKVDAAIVESFALSQLLSKGSYRQIGDLKAEWSKISKSNRLLAYGGYVAKAKWVKANQKFVDDFIRVNYDALGMYKVNQASVLSPAVAYAGENAPVMNAEASAYVADYLGYNDVEPERVYFTSADVDDYKKMFSLLAKSGGIKSAPSDTGKLFYISNQKPK